MNMLKNSLWVIALAFIFIGCKKDSKTCALTTENVAGTYKMTHSYFKATGSNIEVDEFTGRDACERDDLFIFSANGNYTFQDAGVLCDGPYQETGAWSLNGNVISIDGEAGTVDAFSCSGMTVSYTESDGTYRNVYVKL